MNNKAQFTPGPWSLCNWMVGNNTPTGEVTICGPEGDEHICTMDGNEDNQANGNLIAAAPAMYEALQQLVHVEQLRKQAVTENDYVDLVLADSKLQQLVQAVLAQAEGRQG